jgi:hypothetical protein
MDLHNDLAKEGVVLALARVPSTRYDHLEQLGIVKLIGANRIFDSRMTCLRAYRSEVLQGGDVPEAGKK